MSRKNPVLVFARASSASGDKGRDLAAQDAVMAVQQLADAGIADFTRIIPTKEEFKHGLASSTDRTPDKDGSGTHTYFTFVSPDGHVRVVLCAGSGAYLNPHGVQPFMERAVQTIKDVRPALVYVRESDRLGRDENGFLDVLRAMEMLQRNSGLTVHLGWRGEPAFVPDEGSRLRGFLSFSDSRKAANRIANGTRDGRIARTGDKMSKKGTVSYGFGNTPPPGLVTMRLHRIHAGSSDQVLCIDNAALRGRAKKFRDPVPVSFDADGQPADQSLLVMQALADLASGHHRFDVADDLIHGGYISPRLRELGGPSATYLNRPLEQRQRDRSLLISGLIQKLDFYETGNLVVNTGTGTLAIARCFPGPGLQWLSSEQANQIRALAAAWTRVQESPLIFGRVRMTVDGVQGRWSGPGIGGAFA